MGGAPVVIALGGLVFPILLLLAAIVFDAVVFVWFVFRWWHDRGIPMLAAAARGIGSHLFAAPKPRVSGGALRP